MPASIAWTESEDVESLSILENQLSADMLENCNETKGNDSSLDKLAMYRLPLLHVSREGLTDLNGLPEGFMDEAAEITAEYIEGFFQDQDIRPTEMNEFSRLDKEESGLYEFENDKSYVLSTSEGSLTNGGSMAVVLGHEILHANNLDFLMDHSDRVYAEIYDECLSDRFSLAESTNVSPIYEELLGGLALKMLDDDFELGLVERYRREGEDGFYLGIDPPNLEFRADRAVNNFNMETLDVRDETVCQALSFFLDKAFESCYKSNREVKRKYYNENFGYSQNAGDMIAEGLDNFRDLYIEEEGLRGQKFRNVMSQRPEFIRGESGLGEWTP